MLQLNNLQVNQSVYMITEDVSGVSGIECKILSVKEDAAYAGTSTGVEVIIDKSSAKNFFLTNDEMNSEIENSGKHRSFWY